MFSSVISRHMHIYWVGKGKTSVITNLNSKLVRVCVSANLEFEIWFFFILD